MVPESVHWLSCARQPAGALERDQQRTAAHGTSHGERASRRPCPGVAEAPSWKSPPPSLVVTTTIVTLAYFFHITTFYFIVQSMPKSS